MLESSSLCPPCGESSTDGPVRTRSLFEKSRTVWQSNMHFAIVGDSAEAAFIAQAIAASDSHDLTSCCVGGQLAGLLTQRAISFVLVDSAEAAFLDGKAEAVVVAFADSETSISMCRQASQSDCHVLVVPPADASTAFSYELHLLLDESKCGIIPLSGRWYLNPSSSDPLNGVPKELKQIVAETGIPADADRNVAQLHVIDAFCGLGFDYNRITGMDLAGSAEQLLSRSITLASADEETVLPPAAISLKSDIEACSDTIFCLVGREATYDLPTALPMPAQSVLAGSAGSMVDRLVVQFSDKAACQFGMEAFSNSLEVLIGLAKSFRRRRTVDVYFDGISERSVFKTQMTAIGCGILGYATFGLVAYLIFAQLMSPPVWVLQIARFVWFAPVVLFLCAQLLLPIARERKQ